MSSSHRAVKGRLRCAHGPGPPEERPPERPAALLACLAFLIVSSEGARLEEADVPVPAPDRTLAPTGVIVTSTPCNPGREGRVDP